MVKLALIGKGDIAEEVRWCKKYSAAPTLEERLKSARSSFGLANDAIVSLTDAALDSARIIPKMKEFGYTWPTSEEWSVFSTKLFKNLLVSTLFEKVEKIPGKPEFEMGMGYCVETMPVFFEEKIHKTVDVEHTRKKMGFLTEKYMVQEKKLMGFTDIFGSEYAGDKYALGVMGKEKDNRDLTRFSLRMKCNLSGGELAKMYPEKLDKKYTDEAAYFAALTTMVSELEKIINKVYVVIGYDVPPDFSVLVGKITMTRKIAGFTKEDVNGVPVITTQYE